MVGRVLRGAVWVVGALATAGLAGAALLAVRLTQGPIALDLLTPMLERALAGEDGSLTVRIGRTTLEWDERQRDVDLRAREVVARDPDGEEVIVLPVVALRLAPWPLLRGVVEVRTIEVLEPRVRVVRDLDGGVRIGPALNGSAEGQAQPLAEVLRRVGSSEGGAWPALARLVIDDGEIALLDLGTRRRLRLEHVSLEIDRDREGAIGVMRGTVAAGAARLPLHAEANVRPSGELELRVSVRDVQPAALVPALPSPTAPGAAAALPPDVHALLAALGLPVDVTVELGLGPDGDARRLRAAVHAGAGTLVLPAALGGARPVRSVDLVALRQTEPPAVRIDDLRVALPDVELRGHGVVGLGSDARVAVEATLEGVAVEALPRLWPEGVAADARAWVLANVTAGRVSQANLRVTGRVRDADPGSFALGGVDGGFAFEGVRVRWLDGPPPATGVRGTGTFAADAATIRVEAGTVEDVNVGPATVHLTGLGGARPRLVVDADARGPLGRTLAVLDAKPLGIASAIGVDATTAGGTVSGTVRVEVPLGTGTTVVGANAQTRDAVLPRLRMTAGNLTIGLDQEVVTVRGTATLAGTPMTVDGRESLRPGANPRRTFAVRGRMDDAGRAALGLDLERWLTGPVDVQATLTAPARGPERLAFDVDLAPATLDVPILGLAKTAGAPGRAHGTLVLADMRPTALEGGTMTVGGSTITATASTGADGTWRTVDARAVVAPQTADDERASFDLTMRPAGPGSHLRITSDDAGALFRALDPRSDADGGRLTFEGDVRPVEAGVPLDGTVDIRNFTLTRSPVMARVITLASLSGLGRALARGGGGIPFQRLNAQIASRGGTVQLTSLAARGPQLGATATGTFDRIAGTVALTGTLVPSYFGLNTAARRIPLLGDLLTGTDRQGIQSIQFRVTGPLADPTVSIDPATSLAPGVLRDLLRLVPGAR